MLAFKNINLQNKRLQNARLQNARLQYIKNITNTKLARFQINNVHLEQPVLPQEEQPVLPQEKDLKLRSFQLYLKNNTQKRSKEPMIEEQPVLPQEEDPKLRSFQLYLRSLKNKSEN